MLDSYQQIKSHNFGFISIALNMNVTGTYMLCSGELSSLNEKHQSNEEAQHNSASKIRLNTFRCYRFEH